VVFIFDTTQCGWVHIVLERSNTPPTCWTGDMREWTPENNQIANFGEFPFRDCMKKGRRVVVRYSSTYEKEMPNRSF
jgi:hypothetical protein